MTFRSLSPPQRAPPSGCIDKDDHCSVTSNPRNCRRCTLFILLQFVDSKTFRAAFLSVHACKSQSPSFPVDSRAVSSCHPLLSKSPAAAGSDYYTRDPNASHRNKTLHLPKAENTPHDRRHRTMAIELLNGIVGEKGCGMSATLNGRTG